MVFSFSSDSLGSSFSIGSVFRNPKEQHQLSLEDTDPNKPSKTVSFSDKLVSRVVPPEEPRTEEEHEASFYSKEEIIKINAHADYELRLYARHLQEPMPWFHDVYCIRGLEKREERSAARYNHTAKVLMEQKRLRKKGNSLHPLSLAKFSCRNSRAGQRLALTHAKADAASGYRRPAAPISMFDFRRLSQESIPATISEWTE